MCIFFVVVTHWQTDVRVLRAIKSKGLERVGLRDCIGKDPDNETSLLRGLSLETQSFPEIVAPQFPTSWEEGMSIINFFVL